MVCGGCTTDSCLVTWAFVFRRGHGVELRAEAGNSRAAATAAAAKSAATGYWLLLQQQGAALLAAGYIIQQSRGQHSTQGQRCELHENFPTKPGG